MPPLTRLTFKRPGLELSLKLTVTRSPLTSCAQAGAAVHIAAAREIIETTFFIKTPRKLLRQQDANIAIESIKLQLGTSSYSNCARPFSARTRTAASNF